VILVFFLSPQEVNQGVEFNILLEKASIFIENGLNERQDEKN